MQKAFRPVLPALFLLASAVFGCEPLAAQQPHTQTPAPAAGHVATRDAGDVVTAAAQSAAQDAAPAAAPAAATPREFLASAKSSTTEAEKVFGYNVPSFTEDWSAQDADQPGRQTQSGQQTGGQQPGQQPVNQQPGSQPPDPIQPLTAGQKMRRAFRKAFLSPEPYAFSAFSAALTQYREDELPEKDFEDEVGDWGSRFARTFATRTTRSVFTNGIYASLFRQDPRYHRPTHKGFGARLGYAVSRVFVTRGDDGDTEPNYSRFAGSMTASALANVWERSTPGHDRIGTDATLRRFGFNFLYDALSNVLFREIIPTVLGK